MTTKKQTKKSTGKKLVIKVKDLNTKKNPRGGGNGPGGRGGGRCQ